MQKSMWHHHNATHSSKLFLSCVKIFERNGSFFQESGQTIKNYSVILW